MKQIQKGFTLIELMIVVAIIGILAAVAIPAYQDYIVKAKLATVRSTIDPIQLATSLYLQENGSFPAGASNWTSLGIATPVLPNTVTSITQTTNTGALVITLQNIKAASPAIDGTTVTLTPSNVTNQTAVQWTVECTSDDTVIKKYWNC